MAPDGAHGARGAHEMEARGTAVLGTGAARSRTNRRACRRRRGGLFLAAAACLGLLVSAAATAAPGPGDPAPPFRLPGSDGREHAFSEMVKERGVVLAWFPKAFTPG